MSWLCSTVSRHVKVSELGVQRPLISHPPWPASGGELRARPDSFLALPAQWSLQMASCIKLKFCSRLKPELAVRPTPLTLYAVGLSVLARPRRGGGGVCGSEVELSTPAELIPLFRAADD